MRGSDGAGSNFGELGIFHTKIGSMSGMCFLSPPQASESKSTGFRAARPNTAPQETPLPVTWQVVDSPLPAVPPFDRGSAN